MRSRHSQREEQAQTGSKTECHRERAARLREIVRYPLARSIRDDGLLVVGADYSLETGAVEFFEGVPDVN